MAQEPPVQRSATVPSAAPPSAADPAMSVSPPKPAIARAAGCAFAGVVALLGSIGAIVLIAVVISGLGPHQQAESPGCRNSPLALVKAGADADNDAIGRLIDRGADPNQADDTGRTSLYCAASLERAATADLLIRRGARADQTGPDNDLPLTAAVRVANDPIQRVILAAQEKRDGTHAVLDTVTALLDRGASPNGSAPAAGAGSTHDPETALDIAALSGRVDLAKVLLDHRANPNTFHALGAATHRGDVDLVRLLLDHDADPNRDHALTTAAQALSEPMVQALLDHGAQTHNTDALTAVAGLGVKPSNSDSFFDLTPDPHLSDQPEVRGRLASLLIAHGADPNYLPIGGESPLMAATVARNPSMTTLLLAAGADPNAASVFEGQWLAVLVARDPTVAARWPRDPTGTAMLNSTGGTWLSNADITAPLPPLAAAAEDCSPEITAQLLAAGADPNASVFTHFTPLDAAALSDDPACAQLLLAAGANPDPPRDPGVPSPADVAHQAGRHAVEAVLVAAGSPLTPPAPTMPPGTTAPNPGTISNTIALGGN